MIDGIPLNVSVVTRMMLTNLLPFLAYSVRYIAEPIPNGIDITSASATSISVFIAAGTNDTLSDVYSHANSPGDVRFGMPFARI